MAENRSTLKFSYVIALLSSIVVILLYIIAMFYTFPSYLDRIIPLNLIRTLFYSMLFLLILKEILSPYRKERYYITILLILTSVVYSFTVALKEVSQLVPGYFIIIPPSFIYSRCDIAVNCNDFASLSISIPLTIALILLIYSLHGIFITVITRRAK